MKVNDSETGRPKGNQQHHARMMPGGYPVIAPAALGGAPTRKHGKRISNTITHFTLQPRRLPQSN